LIHTPIEEFLTTLRASKYDRRKAYPLPVFVVANFEYPMVFCLLTLESNVYEKPYELVSGAAIEDFLLLSKLYFMSLFP